MARVTVHVKYDERTGKAEIHDGDGEVFVKNYPVGTPFEQVTAEIDVTLNGPEAQN